MLAIWLDRKIEVKYLSPEEAQLFEYENTGISPSNSLNFSDFRTRFPALDFFDLLRTEKTVKERIVEARIIFQKFEKFDFILTKKNLRGCNIGENFPYSFNSHNVKNAIHFYLAENILYSAEIKDLVLARV